MMKMNSIGAYRSLTNKYTDYRKELKNTVFHTKKQSLNDSVSSIFSENGKTTLLNQHLGNNKSNKNGPVELQHWNLPPRYMEIFDNTSDIFKEIQLKCKIII